MTVPVEIALKPAPAFLINGLEKSLIRLIQPDQVLL